MAVDVVQKIIHRLETGSGMRYLRFGLIVLALLVVVGRYNLRAYRNLATQEAMDSAQLARNIAQGKGYTTLFVRPLSIYLLSKHSPDSQPDTIPADLGAAVSPQPAPALTDPACLKGMHPDLANPPVYPLVLAGLMKLADLTKLLPLDYTIPARLGPFWGEAGRFMRHPPDFFIAVFNELLFLVVVGLAFLLARRLFDPSIAWVSALVLLGTELFWRFSVSGLSTMLLLLIFMALVWCLTLLEAETREPRWGLLGFFVFAALAGLLVGLGSLTRYAFAWLILPVLFFVILLAERRQRIVVGVITFVAFAVVLTPWVVRNYSISGTPFGTASFAFLETSQLFPEHRLERSLDLDLNRSASLMAYRQKLIANLRQIITTDLPKLSGTWVSAFFLTGLLVGSPNLAVKRLRVFLLASLAVLVFVQALGHTQLSEDSPEINSENLLVLLGPLVLIYGVSFFYLLLAQIDFPFRELRYAALGAFGLITCLPLLLTCSPLQPRAMPIAYPPYYPPQIQSATDWTKEDELMMSDIPWAVAWYGRRQCAWLTLNVEKDFFAINDYQKPIQALFLTHMATDTRILTIGQWVQGVGAEQGWGPLIGACVSSANQGLTGGIRGFPLNFLQDREEDTKRWRGDRFLLTSRDRPVKNP